MASDEDMGIEFDLQYIEFFTYSDNQIVFHMSSALTSNSGAVIRGNSYQNIDDQEATYKVLNATRLIWPQVNSGIYTKTPFSSAPIVTIKTPGNLLLLGRFFNKFAHLYIESGQRIFAVGATFVALSITMNGYLGVKDIGLYKGVQQLLNNFMPRKLTEDLIGYMELTNMHTKEETAIARLHLDNPFASMSEIFAHLKKQGFDVPDIKFDDLESFVTDED